MTVNRLGIILAGLLCAPALGDTVVSTTGRAAERAPIVVPTTDGITLSLDASRAALEARDGGEPAFLPVPTGTLSAKSSTARPEMSTDTLRSVTLDKAKARKGQSPEGDGPKMGKRRKKAKNDKGLLEVSFAIAVIFVLWYLASTVEGWLREKPRIQRFKFR